MYVLITILIILLIIIIIIKKFAAFAVRVLKCV